MNFLSSTCRSCKTPLQVNAVEWKNPDAHICVTCEKVDKEAVDEFTEILAQYGWWSSDVDETDEFTDEEIIDNEFDNLEPEPPPRCECGADKAGVPWHATWCPMANLSDRD